MRTLGSQMISIVAACVACLAVGNTLAAEFTAMVSLARGEVSTKGKPLREGDAVDFGSTIVTGASAIAAIRIEWSVGKEPCYREYMLSSGVSFEVRRPHESTQCDAGASTSYDGVSGKMGSVGIGKGDGPPESEAAAAQYAEFDALKNALRAGMVFRVNENRSAVDYNRPGNREGSAAACAARCARDARCNAMTFIKDQQMCWLKRERGEAQPANGMVSAVKPINAKAIVTPTP